MLSGLFDVAFEKLALALEEPRTETTYPFGRQDETSQPEYRAVVMFGIFSTHVGTDVAEFVKVGEVGHGVILL